jgi:hypothetical protein
MFRANALPVFCLVGWQPGVPAFYSFFQTTLSIMQGFGTNPAAPRDIV